MSGPLAAKNIKDRFLECPVCLGHFNQAERTPRLLLSCLHACCTQCLEQLLQKERRGQITCPVCRHFQKNVRGPQALPKDLVRDQLTEYLEVTHIGGAPCSDCPDKQQATSRCIECGDNLCDECLHAHKRNRATRQHQTVALGELDDTFRMETKHYCPNHPQRLIECFCQNCSKLCCLMCAIIEHKKHDCTDMKETSHSKIREMEDKLAEIGDVAKKLTTAKEKCEAFIESTIKARDKTISEISEEIERQMNLLEGRRNYLVSQVREESDNIVATATERSQQCEQRLAMFESAQTYVIKATRTDAVGVLRSYPSIMETLVEIANEREIEIVTFRVEFQAKDAPDVTRSIIMFGSVNVIEDEVSPPLKSNQDKEMEFRFQQDNECNRRGKRPRRRSNREWNYVIQ